MKKRIITGIFAFLALAPVLIFSGTFVLPTAISTVIVVSLYELYRCMGVHKKLYLTIPSYLMTVLSTFSVRYADIFGGYARVCMMLFVVLAFYLVLTFVSIIWSHGKLPFNDGLSVFVMTVYIISAMTSLIFVRDFGDSGIMLFILVFIGAFVTDIFAYFTGVFFGKHKLIEDVSPKKTIEGSIGGIVFCTVSFVLFGVIADLAFGKDANLIFMAISGVIISIISQVGDLIMSVVKRHYGIKDYGRLFPGHGGMLDRLDSILVVSLCMAAICVFSSLMGIQIM